MAASLALDFTALDAWCASTDVFKGTTSDMICERRIVACVQISEQLLWRSSEILHLIQRRVGSFVELVILADSAFPDCCIDSISSAHRDAAVIFKIGAPCAASAYSADAVTVVVVPALCSLDDFCINEMKNAVTSQFSMTEYDWTGVVVRGSAQFQFLAAELFPKCASVVHVNPDNLQVIPTHINGCLVVADEFVGRQLALCLPSYDILFTQDQCAVVHSRRERSKRWALIEKLRANTLPIGLVVHSSSRLFADLAYEFAKLLRARGFPTYMLSAGRLTGPKLGNFSDLQAFVIFGCTRTMLAPGADFFAPLLTPFEMLCLIGVADFWCDAYEFDAARLLQTARLLNDSCPDSASSTELSLANVEFSISTFGRRLFKGVPDTMSNDANSDLSDIYDILPGTTGTPRSYTHLDSAV